MTRDVPMAGGHLGRRPADAVAQRQGDLAQRVRAHPLGHRACAAAWCAARRASGRRPPGRRRPPPAGEPAPVVGVLVELGAEPRVGERLEQVEHDALRHRALDHLDVAGRGHRDHVAQEALGAHALEQRRARARRAGSCPAAPGRPASLRSTRTASAAERATPATSNPAVRRT